MNELRLLLSLPIQLGMGETCYWPSTPSNVSRSAHTWQLMRMVGISQDIRLWIRLCRLSPQYRKLDIMHLSKILFAIL